MRCYLFQRLIKYLHFCLIILLFVSCGKQNDIGLDYKTLGTSAHNLLSSDIYKSLNVEIHYMPGYEPPDSSLDVFKQFLQLYLNKPDGITISKSVVATSGKPVLTLKEVAALERNFRSIFTSGNNMAIHILVTDGLYSNQELLGTAYWNTSFSIFGKNIDSNSGAPGQVSRSRLFTLLLCHETGHLLGLVNQGSPMLTNHQDVANGAHCSVVSCLMNFGIETMAVPGAPGTGSIPILDNNCHNDIIANGGR